MLKKLAKYGNSTTLVIDKAILELLNMHESSVVKLHTDGKSLIITPVQPEQIQDKKVSYEDQEAVLQAIASFKESAMKNTASVEIPYSSKDIMATQKEMSDLFSGDAMRHFVTDSPNNLEFQAELAKVAEQYDPVKNNYDYMQAYKTVRNKFYPEMAKLDQSVTTIYKKLDAKK